MKQKSIKGQQNKGIALITLILAIIIMLIISSTLIYNANTVGKTKKLNNMYNDIKLLKSKIEIYYAKYNGLPILQQPYTNTSDIKNININDNETYYVIDLEAIENLTLTYGKEYKEYKNTPNQDKKDIYVINEKSHTIYYIKGIEIDKKKYYTIPEEYTKIEIPEVNKIELKQINENIATLEIDATNKNIGIKTINLYKGNDIYKTYEYTEKAKERKHEIIDVKLPFNEENNWYIQILDISGNITTSEEITLKNENIISTKEDMFALANLVNSGNTLEGKTIKQVNDINLQCNATNIWIPIGNYGENQNNYFAGTYDGKGHKIENIYIDTTSSYQGLFGYNKGTIKNIGIHTGEIKAGDNSGSIVGQNEGTIEKCYNNINLECYQGAYFGGIAGIQGKNSKSKIIKCYNTGNITGKITKDKGAIGGIVGYTNQSNIENSYNAGNITNIAVAQNVRTAGIADNVGGGKIHSCYNTGNITTQIENDETNPVVAGIIGEVHEGEINNCYNIGETKIISTKQEKRNGGITGYYSENTIIKNNYWLSKNSPTGIAEMAEGASKDYEVIEISTQEEIQNIASKLGKDYKQDINNVNKGYPILNWQ